MNFGAKIQIRWFAREFVSKFNFWTKTGLDLKNPDHPTVELKLTHVHWSLWLCHYSKDNQIHKWLKLELRQMECVPLTSEKGKNAVKVWNSRMRRNMFSTTSDVYKEAKQHNTPTATSHHATLFFLSQKCPGSLRRFSLVLNLLLDFMRDVDSIVTINWKDQNTWTLKSLLKSLLWIFAPKLLQLN